MFTKHSQQFFVSNQEKQIYTHLENSRTFCLYQFQQQIVVFNLDVKLHFSLGIVT